MFFLNTFYLNKNCARISNVNKKKNNFFDESMFWGGKFKKIISLKITLLKIKFIFKKIKENPNTLMHWQEKREVVKPSYDQFFTIKHS